MDMQTIQGAKQQAVFFLKQAVGTMGTVGQAAVSWGGYAVKSLASGTSSLIKNISSVAMATLNHLRLWLQKNVGSIAEKCSSQPVIWVPVVCCAIGILLTTFFMKKEGGSTQEESQDEPELAEPVPA